MVQSGVTRAGCGLFLVALSVFAACGPASENRPLPAKQAFPLLVRAEIDGRSHFKIRGTMVWWHHFEFEAPGMWGDDQPTYLNGQEWWPIWPTDENAFCDCDTEMADVLSTPLKSDGSPVAVEIVSARGDVTVAEQPSDANQFTAAIELSDPLPDRDWFEFRISQD